MRDRKATTVGRPAVAVTNVAILAPARSAGRLARPRCDRMLIVPETSIRPVADLNRSPVGRMQTVRNWDPHRAEQNSQPSDRRSKA